MNELGEDSDADEEDEECMMDDGDRWLISTTL